MRGLVFLPSRPLGRGVGGEGSLSFSPLARWGEGLGVRGLQAATNVLAWSSSPTPHPQPLSPAGERGVDLMPLASFLAPQDSATHSASSYWFI